MGSSCCLCRTKRAKIAVAIVVGLFTFSINFGNEMMKISILPLGVWILYFAFRNKGESWEKYRAYAWLGFWANFIFLARNIGINSTTSYDLS
ncbi:hypothetical protein UACE39S_02711 [Ureibacillus acetophenoni]